MVRLTVRYSDDLADAIEREAEEADATRSDVLRKALHFLTETNAVTLHTSDVWSISSDHKTTLRLDDDLLESVDRAADDLGLTRSQLVRYAAHLAADTGAVTIDN